MADADLNPTSVSQPLEGGHRNVSIATDAAVLVAAVPAAIGGIDVARSKRLGVMGWFAIIWLGLVVLMAVVPGIFPVTDLHTRSIDAIVNDSFGPSLHHPLGLDVSGYDLLTRVIYGARASMMVSVGAILFSLAVGGTLGLIAGYFKGKLDLVLTGLFNIMLSMPFLVLALAFVAVLATGDNVSYAGTDIAKGETVLRAGQLLTSREIGVLAAIGLAEVAVYGRPRVDRKSVV